MGTAQLIAMLILDIMYWVSDGVTKTDFTVDLQTKQIIATSIVIGLLIVLLYVLKWPESPEEDDDDFHLGGGVA